MADEDPADRLYYREAMNLSGLSADELTARLKAHVGGGLVFPSEVEIARECVRRARQAEAAELAALGLLEELRRLTGGLEPVAATPCEAQRATAQPTKNRDVGR